MDLFFIGALPALFGGMSASNEPPLQVNQWMIQKKILIVLCAFLPEMVAKGP